MMENAKQGVLFLAFIPGNPSIVSKLKEAYDAKRKAGSLFYLRGAATSPDPASLFRVDLYHRSARSDATVRGGADPPDAAKASGKVSSVAGIFATFAAWEAEIYKIGHAVIHDKIVVIDPFTDDSVVVTGSHNLGFKASYANDENMVIIRNNRSVAEAYAAHILDVYEHYRWRWKLQQPIRDEFDKLKKAHPKTKSAELWQKAVASVGPTVIKKAWQNLVPDDSWQDFYVKNKDFPCRGRQLLVLVWWRRTFGRNSARPGRLIHGAIRKHFRSNDISWIDPQPHSAAGPKFSCTANNSIPAHIVVSRLAPRALRDRYLANCDTIVLYQASIAERRLLASITSPCALELRVTSTADGILRSNK